MPMITDAISGRQIAGWAAAGATVLALHAGVAAWAVQDRPLPPVEAAAAAAVMIDLAPEPAAPEAVEDQISDALHEAAPSDTPAPELPNPGTGPRGRRPAGARHRARTRDGAAGSRDDTTRAGRSRSLWKKPLKRKWPPPRCSCPASARRCKT